MNRDDRVMLGRLEEKMTNIHEDVRDIQKKISRVKGCVNENVTKIATLKTSFKNHITGHNISREWKMWIPSVIAVGIAFVALVIKVGV